MTAECLASIYCMTKAKPFLNLKYLFEVKIIKYVTFIPAIIGLFIRIHTVMVRKRNEFGSIFRRLEVVLSQHKLLIVKSRMYIQAWWDSILIRVAYALTKQCQQQNLPLNKN